MAREPPRLGAVLSDREWQCLFLAVDGETAHSIAATLRISHRTVEEHLLRARQKLGAPPLRRLRMESQKQWPRCLVCALWHDPKQRCAYQQRPPKEGPAFEQAKTEPVATSAGVTKVVI